MDFIQALAIANGVFDQYKEDQPKWWRKLDGTPMLNDLSVRMAEAFRDEAAALATLHPVSAELAAMRSAFHQNMLRAFPDKSHAEIDAEITRATGVAGPVTHAAHAATLMDEQILLLVCEHTGQMINLPIWQLEQHAEFARAIENTLLAALTSSRPR